MRTEKTLVLIGQLASFFGNMATIMLLTRFLSIEQYGILSILFLIQAFLNQLFFSAPISALGRFYSRSNSLGEITEFWRASNSIFFMGATLTIVTVFLICQLGLWVFVDLNWTTVLVFVFVIAISSYTDLIGVIQNAARKRIQFAKLNLSLILVRLGLLVLFASINAADVRNVLIIYMLSSALSLYFIFGTPKVVSGKLLSPVLTKEILKYSAPVWIGSVATLIQQNADRWALTYAGSAENYAVYSATYQLAYGPIMFLFGAIAIYFAPIIFENSNHEASKNDSAKFIKSSMMFCALISILIIIFSVILGRIFIGLILPAEYISGAYLFSWLVASACANGVSQIVTLQFMAKMEVWKLALPKVIITILTIVLCYVAMHKGLEALSIAVFFGSLLQLIWLLMLARPNKNIKLIG